MMHNKGVVHWAEVDRQSQLAQHSKAMDQLTVGMGVHCWGHWISGYHRMCSGQLAVNPEAEALLLDLKEEVVRYILELNRMNWQKYERQSDFKKSRIIVLRHGRGSFWHGITISCQ